MENSVAVMPICRRWFADASVQITPFAATGYSGSRVLAVRGPDDARYVLKSFHAGTSREHVAWVHRLARHLRAEGVTQVAEVVPDRDGETVVADAAGTLWELCRFMPGVAVCRPDTRQAAAAAETLAVLHLAAARLPGAWPRKSRSPGLVRRIEQARGLRAVPWELRRDAVRRAGVHPSRSQAALVAEVARRFDDAIEVFSEARGAQAVERIARLQPAAMSVQPVLRDIWCDHVLHAAPDAAEVTGIIDLHAAGIDTPATDIARLLGSWGVSGGCAALSPGERYPRAIESYERVRPLDPYERRLIGLLHRTAVIFGLDNWFRWTMEDHREFPDAARVLGRIDRLLQELRPAVEGLADREGIVD